MQWAEHEQMTARLESAVDRGKSKPKRKSDRLKPLSLYPLTSEQALRAFMRVDPKTVKQAMARRKRKKQ